MRFGRLLTSVARVLLWLVLLAPVAASADEPPPLATYGHLPGFEMASMSSSGDHIAMLGTLDAQRRLVVLDADQKVVLQVPLPATAKVRGLNWAGDQAVLIEYSVTAKLNEDFTTSKAELGTVLVLPLDGSKPWAVFAGDPDITGGVWGTYGLVQKNGRWVGYFGGVTLKTSPLTGDKYLPTGALYPDVYEVDLQTRKHRIVANRAVDARRGWLFDGQGNLAAVLDRFTGSGQWTLTNRTGQKLASGTDLQGSVSLVGFTPDGTGVVYALPNTGAARDDWFSVTLAGGAPQPFLDGIAVDRVFADDGHRMTGYIERNATEDGHFFDPRHDKIYHASQRAFPGERMILVDANTAFNRLLVKTEGPGDPETWWLVNLATGHADPLGYSYAIAAADVAPVKMLPYSAADGLKMEGVLTLPPAGPARGLPAVILPHGGPAAYDSIQFDWIAQAFASRGYAVLQPNFRGSTGYGVPFKQAGDGEWGRKMQTDISDGLAELVHQGVVDPRRVCIVGASYGGYAALAGVTLQHGIYRCAVAIAGISDLARMIADDSYASGQDPTLIRILKQEIGKGRDLKDISPVRFADKVDVPVLLIHGKDDTVVNYVQSTLMADALRRAGKPVEFVTLKDEDHWLSRGETRMQMLQATVDFVTRHNPPDAPVPAATPAKVP